MKHINRRQLLKTTGVGATAAFGAGAAGGTSGGDSPSTSEEEPLSTFGATAETARIAIDTDDPQGDQEELDIGEPLVAIENGEIFENGDLVVDPDNLDVPDDLVDVILALDPIDFVVEFLEEFDIEEDFIEEWELEELKQEIIDFIEQLDFDEDQYNVIIDVLEILNEEFELGLPIDLLQLEDLFLNPEEGVPQLIDAIEFISDVEEIETTEDLVDAFIDLLNQFAVNNVTTVDFSNYELPAEEGTYELGVFSEDDSATGEIEVGSADGETTRPFWTAQEGDAHFSVSDLEWEPEDVGPGDTIDVEATVANTGTEDGTQDITFEFDGATEDTIPDVTLSGLIGDIAELEEWLIEQVESIALEDWLSILELGVQPEPVEGQVNPESDEAALLMTFPLTTVTLLPDIAVSEPMGATDLPEIEFDLDITLTTGQSGEIPGTIDLDEPNNAATATVVDNEFTADITEFDLLELVEDLDLVELVEVIFVELLQIDLEGDYDLPPEELVDDLDVPKIVENGEFLELIDDRLLDDEPGRHAIEADLEMEFAELGTVLEDVVVGPGEIPGVGEPQDLNGDGLYENINGDGAFDIFDVQTFFSNFNTDAMQENAEFFKFSDPDAEDPDELTIFDVQALFSRLEQWEAPE